MSIIDPEITRCLEKAEADIMKAANRAMLPVDHFAARMALEKLGVVISPISRDGLRAYALPADWCLENEQWDVRALYNGAGERIATSWVKIGGPAYLSRMSVGRTEEG